MTTEQEELLALIIVRNKNFSNAYQLCKVLAWKFGIINCSEIIQRVEQKRFVFTTYPESDTLKFFKVTENGEALIQNKKNELTLVLKNEFGNQIDFIEKLLLLI